MALPRRRVAKLLDQEIREGTNARRDQSTLRHHRPDAAFWQCVVREYYFEATVRQWFVHVPQRMHGDALIGEHCIADQFAERGFEAPLHAHHLLATATV